MTEHTIYVLFEETSDQRGTSEAVGVYSSEDKARENDNPYKRTYVKKFILDAKRETK
jgi:hypothetical protein